MKWHLPGTDYHFGSFHHQQANPRKAIVFNSNRDEDGRFYPWRMNNPEPWYVVGADVMTRTFKKYSDALTYALNPARTIASN